MISVFTPSHDARFLDDAYDSLNSQTVAEWEWAVVLNQGARWTPPPDRRVNVSHADVTGVGEAKSAAVAQTRGDVLVELDHDDLLAPTALERACDALRGDAGFVYSDTAQIREDGSYCADRWGEGWEYQEENVMGRDVLRCMSLAATPHNASYIWFEPNHLRAFTRKAYDKVGGYSDRTVLDDQDLMCRLYQHTRFAHIDECLYLQRVHRGNTQRQSDVNAQIQRETVALYDEHIQHNALAWAKREGLLALDLGSAHNKPDGYLGVDQYPGDGVDMAGDVFDVLGGLEDESVGVIRAVDFLEHIADKVSLWNEMHRVLKHGGMLLTLTPSTDGRGAFCDPTHCAYYNELSYRYWTDKTYAAYVPGITARFHESRRVTYFPTPQHEEQKLSYVCFNGVALHEGPRQGGLSCW